MYWQISSLKVLLIHFFERKLQQGLKYRQFACIRPLCYKAEDHTSDQDNSNGIDRNRKILFIRFEFVVAWHLRLLLE